MPTLSRDVLFRYHRFSLYNSPYTAHDSGCAIDLYPEPEENTAYSPIAGTVCETKAVRAPPRTYAPTHDHLLLIDTGETVARLLHIDPAVEPGDTVAVGEPLGTLVRAGFFDPWVDTHIHLEFRAPDANPYRASGSLPISVDVPLRPLSWDGTGRVVESKETYAVLDCPTHPDPGHCFVGVGPGSDAEGGVIDGGCPHYDGGGLLLDGSLEPSAQATTVSLNGTPVANADGRNVRWENIQIRANGTPIVGLSFFLARDSFGVKLICPDTSFQPDEHVTVTVQHV